MRLKPIHEQVVVLMGASSGIGREAALRFAPRGAKVVLSARSLPELEALAEEIRAAGGTATAVAAEVTEFEQVRDVAERAVTEYGRLDTWVHLAGVGLWAPFEETSPAEWKRVLDVNLNGQAYGAMAALPYLRDGGGGALIHVSSVEACIAMPFQTAYAASKHGMHGFLKSLRLELERERVPISVTEIMPPGTNTPIFDEARTRIGTKPKPFPPIYEASVPAEAILYAAEHPVREMVPGGLCKAGVVAQGVAPRLMDVFLRWQGFHTQKTDEPKTDQAPTSLFEPLPNGDRIQGSLSGQARSWSTYGWLERHPGVKGALLVAAAGSAMWLGARAVGCCAPPAEGGGTEGD